MKALLLPLILLILGTGAGVGAAIALKPEPAEEDETAENCLPGETVAGEAPSASAGTADHGSDAGAEAEYAKLSNQFVVPVIHDDTIAAMVVLSLSVEVPPGGKDPVFAAEPKLRDAFLQVLFNHANAGGFSGNFTATSTMRTLREDLRSVAQTVVGDIARDVLVLDIVRQDL